MKDIPLDSVRNFVVAGHTGSGKTALLDALLFKLGVSDRQGDTAAGTSVCDWTDEEKARKITIWAKPFDALWKLKGAAPLRLVMLDTPGYADFAGQMLSASAVADAALLTVDATSGIQVGTVRAWRRAEALGLPRAIAVTGIDKDIYLMIGSTVNGDNKYTVSNITSFYESANPLNKIEGDINGDKVVDVADLNIVINVALGNATETKADTNSDGVVDVTDINFVINKMLNK